MSPVIEEIPLSEFDLSLSSMRVINQARIEQVERSMYLHGQLQPVVARVCEHGYQIIDGYKRFYVANDLFMKTLQCLVLNVDETQARVLMLSYNRTPQTMESWEEALVLKDLVERYDVSQRELSKLTGYSRSWVSRRLGLVSKIDEEVASQIRMGVLSGSHARALMRLPRGNQAEVARAIHSWGFTSRQSDSLVDAYLEAEDEAHQRQILDHPESVLFKPGSEEATYVWHFTRNEQDFYLNLDQINHDLNTIRSKGRQAFLDAHPENFTRLIHDYTDERKGFMSWKARLEERLI